MNASGGAKRRLVVGWLWALAGVALLWSTLPAHGVPIARVVAYRTFDWQSKTWKEVNDSWPPKPGATGESDILQSIDVDRDGNAEKVCLFRWGDYVQIVVEVLITSQDLEEAVGGNAFPPGPPPRRGFENIFLANHGAILVLDGPDMDPHTDGLQSQTIFLTNGVLASRDLDFQEYDPDGTMDSVPNEDLATHAGIDPEDPDGTKGASHKKPIRYFRGNPPMTQWQEVSVGGLSALRGRLPTAVIVRYVWGGFKNYRGLSNYAGTFPLSVDQFDQSTEIPFDSSNPNSNISKRRARLYELFIGPWPITRAPDMNGRGGRFERELPADAQAIANEASAPGFVAPVAQRNIDVPWVPGWYRIREVRIPWVGWDKDVVGPGFYGQLPGPVVNPAGADGILGTADDQNAFAVPVKGLLWSNPDGVHAYFGVRHPLNLEVRQIAANAGEVRSFYAHHTAEDTDAINQPIGDNHRYDLANGNRDYFTIDLSTFSAKYDKDGDRHGYGWRLPVLDLGQTNHGHTVQYTGTLAGNPNAKAYLFIENRSHADFVRRRDPTNPQWEIGVGRVRASRAPLSIVNQFRTPSFDFRLNSLPNATLPPIGAENVSVSYRQIDLARGGLPALPWRDSNNDIAGFNESEASGNWWSTQYGHAAQEQGDEDDPSATEDQRQPAIFVSIPRHQPPLGLTTETGMIVRARNHTTLSPDPANAEIANVYYWATDPTNTADADEDGDSMEYCRGYPGICYEYDWDVDGDGTVASSEGRTIDGDRHMMRIYIDVNGNGRLDLANLEKYREAINYTGANAEWVHATASRYLFEEPYRTFEIRLQVQPDPDVRLTTEVVDLGVAPHDRWGDPPHPRHRTDYYVLPFANEGNVPLGIVPSVWGNRASRPIGGVDIWPMSHLISQDAEAGITLGGDRLLETNHGGKQWSINSAPPGSAVGDVLVFIDDDSDGLASASEVRHAKIRLALPPGTPLGTYYGVLQAYMDLNHNGQFDLATDKMTAQGCQVKIRVTEAPLPAAYSEGGGPFDPEAVDPADPSTWAGRAPTVPNINTNAAEIAPAVWLDTTLSNDGFADYANGFGTIRLVFSSNRAGLVDPADDIPDDAYDLYLVKLLPTQDPSGAFYYPQPGDPMLIVGKPAVAADPANVQPGEIVAPNVGYEVESWVHYAPAWQDPVNPDGSRNLVWFTMVKWVNAATGEILVIGYVGHGTYTPAAPGDPALGTWTLGNPTYYALGPETVYCPRAVSLADDPATAADESGLYLFYYTGSGQKRRLMWTRFLSDGTFGGRRELGVMTRLSRRGAAVTRLEGLEWAKDPYVFSDYYARDANGDPVPCLGVLFSGFSRGHNNADIFYTRYLPQVLADPENYTVDAVLDIGGRKFPGTGQVPFPEVVDERLQPVPAEMYREGDPADPNYANPNFGKTAAFIAEHPDWWITFDNNGQVDNMTITVGGRDVGPFVADPEGTGLLVHFENNVRTVEVDPTIGLVRFVDPASQPDQSTEVKATYTPLTMRVTTSALNEFEPVGVVLPEQTILVNKDYDPSNNLWQDRTYDLPERLIVLFKRASELGDVSLYWASLSRPLTTNPSGDPSFRRDVVRTDGSMDDTAEYVDERGAAVPLAESLDEYTLSVAVAPYVWFTDVLEVGNELTSPYVPRPGGAATPAPDGQVIGPAVIWMFYGGAGRKSVRDFDPAAASYNFPYAADWDLYYAVFSPRQAPHVFEVSYSWQLDEGAVTP